MIYSTLNNYHEENILSHYPSFDIEGLKVNQREALSKVINYYGNHLSFDQIVSLANREVVNKYSYAEQKYGLALLEKIETGTLTDEDRQSVSNDYRKQEIFDTIENEIDL